MGKQDTMTKKYMSDNRRFADAFNYFLYNGEQVIHDSELSEKDTTELVEFLDKNGGLIAKQSYRDLLKQCVIKKGRAAYYVLLGIENQSEVHYAMPVKNALYDIINYFDQVQKISTEHRKTKDLRNAEFLSGFSRNDRLVPVITLTILWNSSEWDGPRCLHDMMEIPDEHLRKFIPDYSLNLIVPEEIEDFDKFSTEFGYLLEFIGASADYGQTARLLEQKKKYYSNMDWETTVLANTFTKIDIPVPEEKEGGFDMCKAFEDAEKKGKQEGKLEGKLEGKREGKITGIRETIIKTYLEVPTIQMETLAKIADASVDTIKSWILGAGLPLR